MTDSNLNLVTTADARDSIQQGKIVRVTANSAEIATDGTTSQQFVKAKPGTEATTGREPATSIRSTIQTTERLGEENYRGGNGQFF